MTNKTYNIIYADPPWRYKAWSEKGNYKSPEKHYKTMKTEDICALPVPSIAAKDCILFLWITFPRLEDAFRVITAWGFTYKTVAFVWCKLNKKSPGFFTGMGNWTRANAEICLLATKGQPKRQSRSVHQLIVSPLEEHSKKPNIARDKIIELIGDLPRVEFFARQSPQGWDVWGNEVECDFNFGTTCPEVGKAKEEKICLM